MDTINTPQYNIRLNEKEIDIILGGLSNIKIDISEIDFYQRLINRLKNYKKYEVKSNLNRLKNNENIYKKDRTLEKTQDKETLEHYDIQNIKKTEDEFNVIKNSLANGSGVLINPSKEVMETLSMIGTIVDNEADTEKEFLTEHAPFEKKINNTGLDISSIINEVLNSPLDEELLELELEEKEAIDVNLNVQNEIQKEDQLFKLDRENNFNLKDRLNKLRSAPENERLTKTLTGFATDEELELKD